MADIGRPVRIVLVADPVELRVVDEASVRLAERGVHEPSAAESVPAR